MNPSPLDRLPRPIEIHSHMGRLYRELAMLRRLLRLSQSVEAQERPESDETRRRVNNAR